MEKSVSFLYNFKNYYTKDFFKYSRIHKKTSIVKISCYEERGVQASYVVDKCNQVLFSYKNSAKTKVYSR